MEEEKKLKKIIKDFGDGDLAGFFEVLEKEEEKDLKDFLISLMKLKKRIDPSQDLVLKVLNRLLEEKAATNLLVSRPLEKEKKLGSNSFLSKLKIQIYMSKILKVAIPTAIVALVALIVFLNPFGKENLQVSELKDIVADESLLNEANVDLDYFINTEDQLKEVDDSLDKLALNSSVKTKISDLSGIDADLNDLETEFDLGNFFSQEESLIEVDLLLNNF